MASEGVHLSADIQNLSPWDKELLSRGILKNTPFDIHQLYSKMSPSGKAQFLKMFPQFLVGGKLTEQHLIESARIPMSAPKITTPKLPSTPWFKAPSIPPPMPQSMTQQWAKTASKMGAIPGSGLIPPISQPMSQVWAKKVQAMGPLLGTGINWKMAGMGLLSAPFSPWISARAMSQSGMFGGIGGGQGGSGGGQGPIGKMLYGSGGVGGFIMAYTALQVATRGLKTAFDELKSAVQSGAKLYIQAAGVGRSTGQLAQMQLVGAGIGISPEHLNRMLVQGNMGMRGPRTGVAFQGALLRGAMSAGDVETVNQIRNLNKEIQWLANNTKVAAKNISETSGAMMRIKLQMVVLGADAQGMWARFAESMERGIIGIGEFADKLMQIAASYMTPWGKKTEEQKTRAVAWSLVFTPDFVGTMAHLLGDLTGIHPGKYLPKSGLGEGPGTSKFPGGNYMQPVTSQWQRIGFSFGTYPQENYARQTARNTKEIADMMKRSKESAAIGIRRGISAGLAMAGINVPL